LAKCRIKANICGIDYVLSSEDEEIYIKSTVEKVNKCINSITEKNEKLTLPMAATLAALDFCDEAQKANSNADHLRSQIKDYLQDLSIAKSEVEKLKLEIQKLKISH
jgi:cell division protein ZapA (FtsZ GTPase activity inhibitor)